MNDSPYVGTKNMTVAQVFSIFRGLGLRHLPILDDGILCGIMTRHDLTEHAIKMALDNIHLR